VKGVLEAIEVGRKAKMPVQVSHLGVLYTVSPGDNPIMIEAAIKATLKIIDDAREEGIDAGFDLIPNHAAGGIGGSPYLVNMLAPWLKTSGSPDQLAKALRMPDFREEIKNSINSGKHYGLNPFINPSWAEGGKIVECLNASYKDKTIVQIASDLKIDQIEALMHVIIADSYTKIVRSTGDDSRLLAFAKHPEAMIGIDTFAVDDTWKPRLPTGMLPCENSFGGFPRFFRRAVRETKTITLEDAVRKVTGSPARKFRLKNRGLLRTGYVADLTIFNPETITDRGSQLQPMLYPEGVEHIIINGVQVVKKGKHTEAKPGKILRRET
jgi:N-acyl-D-aspartate/D-glutamate deacylase